MNSGWLLVPAAAAALAAQTYVPGPQAQVFLSDVDGTAQPYAIYVPRNLDLSRKYPLVISLHSEASNHRLDLRRVVGRGNLFRQSDAEAANGPFPPFPDLDYLVVSPLARGSIGYQGIPERDVYDVLAEVEKNFPVDRDRVYLTGASMGGGGALWLALTRPDVWAAVAVLCPSTPPGLEDLAGNALNLPVRLFQGDLDPTVFAESTREWRDRLQAAGVKVEYTDYPQVQHNVWDFAYQGGQLFRWFSQFRRNGFPASVHFTTSAYKYPAAYWVRIDGLTPGTPASIDARFTGSNRIEIRTRGVDGFTLLPEGHASYDAARPLAAVVDGAQITIAPRAKLSFSKEEKGWVAGFYQRPPNAKGPGQEGPLREALARKHLYVYGTLDSPDDRELARRRAEAEQAANWAEPPLPLMLTLRARADNEVTEGDLAGADLVLFGTRQTNRLIARFGDRLPMELSPSAADYGLVEIAPAGDRYIVVSSGLAWWTGLIPPEPPYKALLKMGDYVVFRRSLANVVAEGSFDRNWKVPAGQATKLAASGVIRIR